MQQLATIFSELGISQYLDVFIDQGFDSWETILLVTEADLDALRVKLGHRRKLQRRIASFRSAAPETAAVLPTDPSVEGPRSNGANVNVPRPRLSKADVREPDENAPERPPSAYVLFSNKMREDLKGRNLTFTEIAKLVGENWQNLSPADKEPFESQAQFAKDRYNNDMAEYKKTAEYRKYMLYLHEFRAKHAHQAADKDSSKRVKLTEPGAAATGSSSNPTPNRRSRSRSSSEGTLGADSLPRPSSGRQGRLGSVASLTDSQYSTSNATLVPPSQAMAIDEPPSFSPTSLSQDRQSERSPSFSAAVSPRDAESGISARRGSAWLDEQQVRPPPLPLQQQQQQQNQRSLPRLYDVVDGHRLLNGPGPSPSLPSDASGASSYSFPLRSHQSTSPVPSQPISSLRGSDSRPPSLRHEYSSAGSSSSASTGFPHTPVETPVSMQTFLTGPRAGGGGGSSEFPWLQHPPFFRASPAPLDQRIQPPPQTFPSHSSGASASMPALDGFLHYTSPSLTPPCPSQGGSSNYSEGINGTETVAAADQQSSLPSASADPNSNGTLDLTVFDGLGALLKAGEIVDRRTTQ